MKFFQGDSTIKRMADTIGLPWFTFHRTNRYAPKSKISVIGLPWYNLEEWKKTKKISEDPESFHETYLEWLRYADKAAVALANRDKPFERVKIIAQEYAKWCDRYKIRKNRRSRIKYVEYLLLQKLNT